MKELGAVGYGDLLLSPERSWMPARKGSEEILCVNRSGQLEAATVKIVPERKVVYEVIASGGVAVIGKGCSIASRKGFVDVESLDRRVRRGDTVLAEQVYAEGSENGGPSPANSGNAMFAEHCPSVIAHEVQLEVQKRLSRREDLPLTLPRVAFGIVNGVLAEIRKHVERRAVVDVDNHTFPTEISIDGNKEGESRSLGEVLAVSRTEAECFRIFSDAGKNKLICGGFVLQSR